MQMTSTNLLYIYVIIINVVTFFIYGLDKSRAKAGQWRIPEAQLIFLAVIGGSVGALAGMKVFHHKTRKPKFKTGNSDPHKQPLQFFQGFCRPSGAGLPQNLRTACNHQPLLQ